MREEPHRRVLEALFVLGPRGQGCEDANEPPASRYPRIADGTLVPSIKFNSAIPGFTAAKGAGLKNYFIEQTMDLTKASVAFLKTLKV